MWISLYCTDYCILFKNSDVIEIFVTDFVKIWSKHFSCEHFLASLKESNRSLEIEESELLAKARDMLENVEKVKKVTISLNTKETLTLEITKSYGYPVKLRLCFTEGSKELFFQKVTHPLLQTIQDLKSSQQELCQLLVKKDKEIKEYKDEGGRIALRHLKTPLFNEEAHMETHRSYNINFGIKEIPTSILDKKLSECTTVIKEEQSENRGDHGRVERDEMKNVKSELQCSSTSTESIQNGGDVLKQDSLTSNIEQESGTPEIKQEPTTFISVKSELLTQARVSPRKKKKLFKL